MGSLVSPGREAHSARGYPEGPFRIAFIRLLVKGLTETFRGRKALDYLFLVILSMLVVLELAGLIFFVCWAYTQVALPRLGASHQNVVPQLAPGVLPIGYGIATHLGEAGRHGVLACKGAPAFHPPAEAGGIQPEKICKNRESFREGKANE